MLTKKAARRCLTQTGPGDLGMSGQFLKAVLGLMMLKLDTAGTDAVMNVVTMAGHEPEYM